jgi:hypothetical protein
METRHCKAYGPNIKRDGHEYTGPTIGEFDVPADGCLTEDTITWRGKYWNMRSMARYGQKLFPSAYSFGFSDSRPLSGIRS